MHYELILFICIIAVTSGAIHTVYEFQCSCSCCTSDRCSLISPKNYTTSTCETCQSICETEFASICMKGAERVSYQCTSDVPISRAANPQMWFGSFRATDDCDKTDCCCLTDVIYFNPGRYNNLHIQGRFTGQCSSSSPTLDTTQPIPNTNSLDLRFQNQPISVTLSGDGGTVTFIETDNMACRYKAIREANSASSNTINWISVLFLTSLINIRNCL
ncbi:unnamed protein product [Adineta ricciae]|uniref:Uncharacterized protein n=1 Tax=Adineta ricciae TaxID=249248 RepID=A0A814XIA7_ADIRI|nr:unnamed protein product [Adineta ricciae]CAF1214420.1 unnamed protein product [Adineta ricciae]